MKNLPRVLRQTWWAIGGLGVALTIYLSLMHDPPTLDVRRLWTAIALVGLGVALEFAQLASGYRDVSYGDMVADALGVGIGWLLGPPRLPNLLGLTPAAPASRP